MEKWRNWYNCRCRSWWLKVHCHNKYRFFFIIPKAKTKKSILWWLKSSPQTNNKSEAAFCFCFLSLDKWKQSFEVCGDSNRSKWLQNNQVYYLPPAFFDVVIVHRNNHDDTGQHHQIFQILLTFFDDFPKFRGSKSP